MNDVFENFVVIALRGALIATWTKSRAAVA
jgi:hypothetical protein